MRGSCGGGSSPRAGNIHQQQAKKEQARRIQFMGELPRRGWRGRIERLRMVGAQAILFAAEIVDNWREATGMAVRCSKCGRRAARPVNRCWKCGQQFSAQAETGGACRRFAMLRSTAPDVVRRNSRTEGCDRRGAGGGSNRPRLVPPPQATHHCGKRCLPRSHRQVRPHRLPVCKGSRHAAGDHTGLSPESAGPRPVATASQSPRPRPLGRCRGDHRDSHGDFCPRHRWISNWVAISAAAVIALIGFGMGIWGLYSKRRGWALFGILMLCAAIGLATFTALSGASSRCRSGERPLKVTRTWGRKELRAPNLTPARASQPGHNRIRRPGLVASGIPVAHHNSHQSRNIRSCVLGR